MIFLSSIPEKGAFTASTLAIATKAAMTVVVAPYLRGGQILNSFGDIRALALANSEQNTNHSFWSNNFRF